MTEDRETLEEAPASGQAAGTAAYVADIVEAAERAVAEMRADAEQRARERIAEGDRAAQARVEAAEAEARELLAAAHAESGQRRSEAESKALEIVARAQQEADSARQQAETAATEARAKAEDDAHELVREARAAARETLKEGTALSDDLRQLGESLMVNAARLLRDVREAHDRLVAGLERFAPGRSEPHTTEERPHAAPARRRGARPRQTRGTEELDVPEFIPRA